MSNRVINVGSPMQEVLDFYENKITQSNILTKMKLKSKKWKKTYKFFSSRFYEILYSPGTGIL